MVSEKIPVVVEEVRGGYVECESHCWYRGGTNDYSVDRIEILKVRDREGAEREGVWEEEWTELFPGVRTREAGGKRTVRIEKSALPVRVLKRYSYEYVSYDHHEHCSHEYRETWVSYEG